MNAPQQRKQEIPELRPVKGIAPPHDLDAEASVLSACVLDNHAIDLCTGLKLVPEMFYSHANRLIFETILELREGTMPCDIVTIASRLRDTARFQKIGGSPYLSQIVDAVPSIQNVESYAMIVRDKWRVRQTIAVMKVHAAEGYGQLDDVQAWIDTVEADVADMARHFDSTRGMRSIGEAGASAMQRIVDAQNDGKDGMVGVPFGYERIDRRTRGMMGSDLIIVAARPGMGKTSFAMGVAINVAKPVMDRETDRWEWGDGSVGFFSLEMDEEQLALRGIAVQQKLQAQQLRAFEVAKKDWPVFIDGVAWEQRASIHIDPTPRLSVADVRSRSRRLAADLERKGLPPLKLIIVDYLQIMGTQRYNQSREELVGDGARGLKALAKELKVPVMALAQLNRAVETRTSKDKRPQLSDLRESGTIEQEADLVAFLYRDEYYFPDSADKGIAEFIIGKQRSGPTGTVKLRFTPEYTRFDNLADEYEFDEYDDLVDAEEG